MTARDHGGIRPFAIVAMSFLFTCAGATDFEVRGPLIDVHEFEYDLKIARGFDSKPANSPGRGVVHEFEFGVSDWWSPAIEGEWGRQAGPDEPAAFQGLTFENRFQLTKHGEHWADLGLFVEYERGHRSGSPNALRLGPLLQKEIGPTVSVLNVVAVKEFGTDSRRQTSLAYAWQTRWQLSEEFQPGLEVYGGSLEAGIASPRQRLGGPVFFGVLDLGERQDIRYELGYLHGFDGATPRGTLKLLVGYEYRF